MPVNNEREVARIARLKAQEKNDEIFKKIERLRIEVLLIRKGCDIRQPRIQKFIEMKLNELLMARSQHHQEQKLRSRPPLRRQNRIKNQRNVEHRVVSTGYVMSQKQLDELIRDTEKVVKSTYHGDELREYKRQRSTSSDIVQHLSQKLQNDNTTHQAKTESKLANIGNKIGDFFKTNATKVSKGFESLGISIKKAFTTATPSVSSTTTTKQDKGNRI